MPRPRTGPSEQTAAAAYACPAGSAERRWMGATMTDFLATGATTGGAFCLVEERAAEGEYVPLHRHAGDMESFYVVEGALTIFLEGQAATRLTAGGFAHVPAGTVHGFRIESATARYLILTTPRHGEFYRAITEPADAGGRNPGLPVDGARIKAACRTYGIEPVAPLP